jgi:hypothetical protein
MPSSAAPTSLHFRSAFPTPGQRGSILPVSILNRPFFITFPFSFPRSSCPVRRFGLTLSAPGRVLLRTWRVISALPHFQGAVSRTLSQGPKKKGRHHPTLPNTSSKPSLVRNPALASLCLPLQGYRSTTVYVDFPLLVLVPPFVWLRNRYSHLTPQAITPRSTTSPPYVSVAPWTAFDIGVMTLDFFLLAQTYHRARDRERDTPAGTRI